MRILKIIDGFVTNSSSECTTILVALKKETDLGEMLENIGLSKEDIHRFYEETGWTVEDHLEEAIDNDILDPNIYKIRDKYDILTADIVVYAFGDDIDSIDYSDFRVKFNDELIEGYNNHPVELVPDKFYLLGDLAEFYGPHLKEEKKAFKQRVKKFVKLLLKE